MAIFDVLDQLVRGLAYVILALLVAPLFPFIYVVQRWRGGTERGAGTYAALLYFRTSALLLALAGAANLLYGTISETPPDAWTTRLSWGLFLGSVVFMLLNTWLGRFVAVDEPREARRVFGGFLMIMSGLLSFFAVVMLFVALFWETEDHEQAVQRADELKLYASWSVLYLATYLASTVLLCRGAREK